MLCQRKRKLYGVLLLHFYLFFFCNKSLQDDQRFAEYSSSKAIGDRERGITSF